MRMDEWRDGWDRAAQASELLQDALRAVGAAEGRVARVRPLVSGRGTPWAEIGAVPASLAEKLAEALRNGTP
ncbi:MULTISPECIES: hypothetical protein [unclassified Streptomyces]|uniref:hypothetical protein n=1 Tax=unclassified Streptomyces TaxID=2593676 RepID=UPI003814C4EC